jgi:tripartite-type tricarboxylate transporter receptor subunit TctC
VLLASGIASQAAQAQPYPNRSVKLVTQGAAGSGPDVIARLITDQLARIWGQQIVILNHTGAGGSAAARVAAQAPPDGYTLYMAATSSFIVMPEIFPNLPFDLDRDFVRIALTGDQPMALAVPPSLGVNSLPELIALSKSKSGQILYAGNARGTFPNLTVERLRKETGAAFTFIPYPGAAGGLQDLMGGRISMICESIGPLAGAIAGGVVKVVAVASAKRLPNFPELAAVAETVPGFVATGWFALMAPAGTPDAIVRKVNADVNAVMMLPELKQRFEEIGHYPRPMSPDETTQFIRAEQALWRPIVRQLGLGQP